jgi:hypothetical protein
MDITRNRSQLIHEAADKLALVGTGQSLEPEYYEKIEANVDPLLAQLDRDGIVAVGDSENIPVEVFDPIAGLLGNVSSPLAGRNYDPQIKEYYEHILRRITSAKASYEILEGTYF